MKRSLLIVSILALALVVLSEAGVTDLDLRATFRYSDRRISSIPASPDSVDANLSLGEVRTAFPGRPDISVIYSEKRESPWTRWVPIIKSGQTKIVRHYRVVQAGKVLLAAEVRLVVRLTTIGILSTAKYQKEVDGSDWGAMNEWMQKEISNRPNQALEPTATAVTIRAGARLAPAVVVAHL